MNLGPLEVTQPTAQLFRAGDAVKVLTGYCAGETWVVAVYDASTDEAHIAGYPYACITNASKALALHRAATDVEHADMLASVENIAGMDGDDPRRRALHRVRQLGGTP